MRSHPILTVVASTVIVSFALVGCSSSDSGPAASSPQTSSASSATSSLESHTAAPGAVGQSPGGVTTAVGAPSESTEDEYSKACEAAKEWMATQGGDPKTQFEPYLGSVQSSDSAGPGTFGTPWSKLSPARQAAVIVAAEAAANGLCG